MYASHSHVDDVMRTANGAQQGPRSRTIVGAGSLPLRLAGRRPGAAPLVLVNLTVLLFHLTDFFLGHGLGIRLRVTVAAADKSQEAAGQQQPAQGACHRCSASRGYRSPTLKAWPSSATQAYMNSTGSTENLTNRTEPSAKTAFIPLLWADPKYRRQTVDVAGMFGVIPGTRMLGSVSDLGGKW